MTSYYSVRVISV